MKTALALLIALFFVLSLKAEDLSAFEPVLVPVYALQLRGYDFSTWSTEFTVHNASNRPVEFFPAYAGFAGPFRITLNPGQSESRILQRLLSSNHLVSRALPKLIFVERSAIDFIAFNLRVWNSKQTYTNWGTEIPVVRMREFRDQIRLINVPVTSGFRTLLRIYSVDHDPEARFTVRAVESGSRRVLFEKTVALQILANSTDASYADFLELPINSDLLGTSDTRIWIEIDALKNGSKVWAFVTVTSDLAQIVTTITPR